MGNKTLGFRDLDAKIIALVERYENIRSERDSLQEEIDLLKEKLKETRTENIALSDQVSHLKMMNAMGGNQEYKKLMKLRMNKLIKEVDACIAQIKNKQS